MAELRDVNKLMLREPTLEYGTVTNPESLTASTDPDTIFSSTNTFGLTRMGSVNLHIDDSFVEYLRGTPHKVEAKDLLQRNTFLECIVNQWQKEFFEVFGRHVVASGTYELYHIGTDVAVEVRYAFRGTGYTRDGLYLKWLLYSGGFVGEVNGIAPSGTDYVDKPVIIQAYPHSGFTDTIANDRKNIGVIWQAGSS